MNELQRGAGQFQAVDVRSPSEFAAGHIPGTINMPMEQVEGRLADLNRGLPVVLVCKSGARAEVTRRILASHLPNVGVLNGGTDAWTASRLPLVQCQASRWALERQVRLSAGVLILVSLILAVWVNMAWLGLTAFVGAGLTFAGVTDICGMGLLLARMPWNK